MQPLWGTQQGQPLACLVLLGVCQHAALRLAHHSQHQRLAILRARPGHGKWQCIPVEHSAASGDAGQRPGEAREGNRQCKPVEHSAASSKETLASAWACSKRGRVASAEHNGTGSSVSLHDVGSTEPHRFLRPLPAKGAHAHEPQCGKLPHPG